MRGGGGGDWSYVGAVVQGGGKNEIDGSRGPINHFRTLCVRHNPARVLVFLDDLGCGQEVKA